MDRVVLRSRIVAMLNRIREHKDLEHIDLSDDDPLGPQGWELDSLDLAELSTVLEIEMGHDPFSNRLFPLTVSEIVAYYRGVSKR